MLRSEGGELLRRCRSELMRRMAGYDREENHKDALQLAALMARLNN